MTQDDGREKKQIEIFGLQKKSKNNRGSKYLPDATITVGGKRYAIELKTGYKTSFSTARGMSRDKVESWKRENDFYIFSKYEKTEKGFEFKRHIACTNEHLKFFFDHVIDKVDVNGHAGKVGLGEYASLVKPLLEGALSKDLLDRVDKTVKVGTEYNDPKINIQKIVDHGGFDLDLDKCVKVQLEDYIKTVLDKQKNI